MIRFLSMAACLLLAGRAFAHMPTCPDGPPRWTEAEGSRCKLWNWCPNGQETVTWSGACVDGFAEGPGVNQWFHAGEPVERYEGTMRAGKTHGRGTNTSSSGERYDGEWRDGAANGRGTYSYSDGVWYEGDVRDGQLSGHGVMFFTDGSWYKGEWRDGRPNGYGTANINDRIHTGTWRDGCHRHGDRKAWVTSSEVACDASGWP